MFVECELKHLFVSTFNTLVDGSARLHPLASILLSCFLIFVGGGRVFGPGFFWAAGKRSL